MRSFMRLYLSLLAILMCGFGYAQKGSPDPGAVSTPAALPNPMDPNSDGWITSTGNTFSGPLDETEFELPYLPIPTYEAEPVGDVQVSSTSCTMYDLAGDAANVAESTYYYYQDRDGIPDSGNERIFFRFRVGRLRSNSVALSILIDTNQTFGFAPAPGADPDAVVGNPGFELEVSVTFEGGPDILVYNVDGMPSPAAVIASYPINTHLQTAYALNQNSDCTDTPGFIDIYLPLSALGVSSTTQLRMVGASSETTGSVLGGNADDIAGVDGNAIPNDDDQYIAAIGAYPPFTFGSGTNRPPSCTDGSVAMNENSANGTSVYTVSASDPDGDALTYTITSGNTGTAFAINSSGQITVNDATVVDFETTPSFALTVRVSDGTLFDDAVITINLNDVNEIPSATDAAVSLNENSANGTAVHTVSASDPDGDALTYTITSGNTGTAFAINSSGQITVNDATVVDFETTPSFTLTVRVSDGTLFDDAVITINLNDVNEIPSATDATVSLNENSANGTAVHTVSASDPDGDALTYTITSGNTGTAFAINSSGQITVNDATVVDFETTPSFALTVRVSDGTLFDDAVITINLNDVNETPSATDATVSLDENSANGTAVHTVSASDPDGDALTYAITGTVFAINSSGQISVNNAAALDFEATSSFSLTVTVSDGTLSDNAVITINLNDVNEAPSATDATVSLDENSANGTAVHTVSASDPDGDALTYTITGTVFAINSSGQISVNNAAALDFETTSSFSLTVTVSDGTLSDNVAITINLNDVNEIPANVNKPPVVADATAFLDENSVNGTTAHQVFASDPDGDELTYQIIAGNTASAFAISSSGQISVSNAGALDFETTPSFSLTIRASDRTLSDDAVITIHLQDVNELPPDVNDPPVALDATVWLDENSSDGAAVHTVSASDPDGDPLTYSIIGGNASAVFAMNSSGKITVNNAAVLNFEDTPVFTLTVRASDGTLSDEAIVTINVRDINEAPSITDAIVTVAENLPNGTVIHKFIPNDPDANDAMTFSIVSGDPGSAFGIDANSGEVAINNIEGLDPSVNRVFTLSVMVTDRGGLSATAILTIELESVDEPNVISPLKGFSPNGDGLNDFWLIEGIEAFPDNVVKVFNRWGHLVFETKNYDNNNIAWRGNTTKDGPETTYYFLITVKGLQPITGYVIQKN